MTLRTGAMAVAACLLGAAIPVALASEWSTAPAQLSQNVSNESSTAPSMAIADNGDMAAVWLEQAVSGTSTSDYLDGAIENGADSGAGFAPAVQLGASDPLGVSNNYSVPQVAEDGQGDAVAVWLHNGHVVWARQEQPATNFTAAASGSPIDGGSGTIDADLHVAMDAGGDAIAIWAQQDTSTAAWSVYYATLPAGTDQNFSDPVELAGALPSDPGAALRSNPYPQVALNQDSGDANLSYIDGSSIGETQNYLPTAVAAPTGSGWPPVSTIYTATSGNTLQQLAAAMNEGGATLYAWVDGGSVWSGQLGNGAPSFGSYPALPVDEGPEESDPQAAIYPSNSNNDQAAVAFYSALQGAVVVATRPNGSFDGEGNTWSSTTPEPAAAGGDQQPQVSIADDGIVTMLWAGPGTGSSANEMEAIRSNVSGGFSDSTTETLLTDAGSPCATAFIAPCIVAAADTSGDVAAAWVQPDSSSVQQIDAQCLEADSPSDDTVPTDTTVYPADQSTLSAASCVDTNTTPTVSTQTTISTPTQPAATTPTQTTPTTPTQTTPTTPTQTATSTTTATTTTPTIFSPTTSGTVLVKLPGSNRFVAVNPNVPIPNGSVVNATHGTVQLTFSLPDGQTETASFWGGEFSVTISPSGAVRLKLAGGSFKSCPRTTKHRDHAASVARSRKPTKKRKPGSTVRGLWSKARGNFTTSGRNGSAAVLGTTWLIRDQCDGTYFYVKSTSNDRHGAILVTVLHPHRHKVRLRRGHHLLAPAPGY